MKSLLLSVSLFIVLAAQSQHKTLIRVFDDKGKLTYKGSPIKTSDSTLTLWRNNNYYDISITGISKIKLKSSVGETILLSSLGGGFLFGVLGAASSDNDSYFSTSAGEGALIGFGFGAVLGAFTGALVAGSQKRPVFYINMTKERWMKVKPILDNYLPVEKNRD